MSDGDERPRPQYGEYATPEEQRARIHQPDAVPPPASPAPPVAPAYRPAPPFGVAGPLAPGAPGASVRSRAGDRIVTAVLLGYGLVNVVMAVPQYVDLPTMMTTMMKLLGVSGTFTNIDGARTWGMIAAIALVAGYAITLLLSLLRLRAHKLTWWIPLMGAVVTYLVVGICVVIPAFSDPAFTAYLSHPSG